MKVKEVIAELSKLDPEAELVRLDIHSNKYLTPAKIEQTFARGKKIVRIFFKSM